jgi:hypothetical protein
MNATGEVMILVWDAVADLPVPQAVGAEDVSGRGLGIVDWLSGRQWGWYLPAAPYGGKVTQALIDCPWRDQPPRLSRRECAFTMLGRAANAQTTRCSARERSTPRPCATAGTATRLRVQFR